MLVHDQSCEIESQLGRCTCGAEDAALNTPVPALDMSPDSSAAGVTDDISGVDNLSVPGWPNGSDESYKAERYERALLMILAQARWSATDLMMYMSGPVIEGIVIAALQDRPDPYPEWESK